MLNADHPPNGAHGPTALKVRPIVGAAARRLPECRRRDCRAVSPAAGRRAGSMIPTQVGEAVFDRHRSVNLFRNVRKPRPARAQAEGE